MFIAKCGWINKKEKDVKIAEATCYLVGCENCSRYMGVVFCPKDKERARKVYLG